jgi:hypothetical protein
MSDEGDCSMSTRVTVVFVSASVSITGANRTSAYTVETVLADCFRWKMSLARLLIEPIFVAFDVLAEDPARLLGFKCG